VLALAFAWAGLAKLAGLRRWWRSLGIHGLPLRRRGAVAIAVPAAELGVTVLIAAVNARTGAAAAVALVAAFSLVSLRARSIAGDRLPCGCFGSSGERDWRWLIARNSLLAALAAWVVVVDESTLPFDGVHEPAGELLTAALTAAGIALAVWTARSTSAALRR
jgi:hypothetical protein